MQAAGGLNLSAIQRHGRSLAAEHTPCAKHYILRINSRNTIQKTLKQALRLARCFRRPGETGKPSAIRRRPLKRPEFAFPRGFRRSASDGHVARLRCPVSRIFDHDV